MNKLIIVITLSFILCNNLFASGNLTFSKDSIIAFDGKDWSSGSGDDSIEIRNTSSNKSTIDSIKVYLPVNEYNAFQIGWIFKFDKDSLDIRIFNSTNFDTQTVCSQRGINLLEYKYLPQNKKITISPNSNIKLYSPYISKSCTTVGMFIDCFGFGGCYSEGTLQFYRKDTGVISLFSNNIEYTVSLSIKFYKWTTSVTSQNKMVIKQAILKTPQKTITLLGRSYNPGGKLQMHRMLQYKKQNSTVYIVK